MALSELYNLKPFRRYIFWPLAILPSLLIISVAVLAYVYMSNQDVALQKQELKGIASRTANFIPIEIHERLQQPTDRNSDDYELIHLYLQSVMAGNDDIDDIYTLRVNEAQDSFVYVVGGAKSQDRDGDNIIDEWEQQKTLGAAFDTDAYPLALKGMEGPTVDKKIMFRHGDASLTAFAPLHSDEGATIGVIGVDYSAHALTEQRHLLFGRIAWVAGIVIALSIGAAWLITHQITKPLRELITALDRVRHGEYNYEIPETGRLEQRVVARLFNTNKEILMNAGVARQQAQLEQEGKEGGDGNQSHNT